MTRPLRIAMIGSRGVPATYGGIERHVEEIGARLAERGHAVTVYCRPGYTDEQASGRYRGMRTVRLPAIATKHLEALSHSALATGRAVLGHHDVYHFHAVGPGLFTPVARASTGAATVLTVHGLDFDRAKWGPVAQRLVRRAEWVAAHMAHALVVVAPDLVEHYRSRYGIEPTFIRNGVTDPENPVRTCEGRYMLFVGRLTPEKGPQLLLEAFRRLPDPDLRLIVVGGSSHTGDFVARLHEAAARDPRVDLRGYVYGADLAALYAGARLFVQPSSLEGMPLTVLEAASYGVPLLASDIPVHRELLGAAAAGRRLFRCGSVADLETGMREALAADDESERAAARCFGAEVRQRYSWDEVTDELEALYERTVQMRRSARHRGSAGSIRRTSRRSPDATAYPPTDASP